MKQEIEIITTSKKSAEDKCPKMALLFLITGVWGILSLCHSIKGMSFPLWFICCFATISCWLIWYVYYSKGKLASIFLLLFVMANVIFLFVKWDSALEQGRHIIGCLTSKGDTETMAVNEIMVFWAMILSFSMAMLEFMMKNHSLLYLLTTLLLLGSPLLGIQSDARTVLLMALFQSAFWAMRVAGRRGKKTLSQEGGKQSLLARSGIITGGAVFSLFLAVLLAMPAGMEGLYNAVYQVEGQITRILNRVSGKAAERVSGGKVSRGNHYQTGAPHLELSMDCEPTETLYLYGFQGGEYVGGDWLPANDEEIFLDILAESKWPYGQLFSVYRSMYYEINHISQLSEAGLYYSNQGGMKLYSSSQLQLDKTGLLQGISLDIVHCNGQYDRRQIYSPYCGSAPQYYTYAVDGWRSESRGYGYSYYEQKDMEIDWDAIKSYGDGQKAQYQILQQLYMEKIQDVYTRVPTELLPRLAQLCKENPQNTLEDITAFIIYTLHSNTSYTMTPGWIPLNEDPVEYFLFESGRGYCEHYAAAAVLMYRMYGVPARYVTGYSVPALEFQMDPLALEQLVEQMEITVDELLEIYRKYPDSYIENEDGIIRLSHYVGWNAVATDEMAHAWAEIFLEDYGWMPIEVTPASDGSMAARYPGFSEESLQQKIKEYGWDIKTPSLAATASKDDFGQDGKRIPAKEDSEKQKKKAPVVRGVMVYFLCLLPIALECNRLRREGKLEKASSRKIFGQLLQMFQYGGYLAGYDGTEEDFAARLAEQFKEVPQEDIRRLQDIVSEAAYGMRWQESGQEEYVRRIYRCLAQAVYRRCKWYQKLVFRYWKGYL